MIDKSMVVHERLPWPARKLHALVERLLKVSPAQVTRIIRSGGVRVNGRTARHAQDTLEAGDLLHVQYAPEPARPKVRAQSAGQPLEIVFQDEHLVVVNKPPELLTVPTPHRERHTLISLLEKRLQQTQAGAKAYCVHRLDRGVSGLLVFGKQLEVAEQLRNQFAERKPRRHYVAIVQGTLEPAQGTFRSYMATDKNSLARYSTPHAGAGELAITHYRALQALEGATVVEVWLETGRRNQIRVHFAEAGHAVLGDTRYGSRAPTAQWPHKRLALHAATLGFAHPVTKALLEFSSPWPREMLALAQPGEPAKHLGSPAGTRRPKPSRRRKR